MLPCRRELNFIVFAALAFNMAFWLNLERLGRLLGLLGASWALLGHSWGQLGGNLSALETSSGALRTNLGPTWALLGPAWAHEASLELLLEALGRVLEAPRSCLGGPKRSRELYLEAQSAPRRKLGGPKPSEEPILEASSSLRC